MWDFVIRSDAWMLQDIKCSLWLAVSYVSKKVGYILIVFPGSVLITPLTYVFHLNENLAFLKHCS